MDKEALKYSIKLLYIRFSKPFFLMIITLLTTIFSVIVAILINLFIFFLYDLKNKNKIGFLSKNLNIIIMLIVLPILFFPIIHIFTLLILFFLNIKTLLLDDSSVSNEEVLFTQERL